MPGLMHKERDLEWECEWEWEWRSDWTGRRSGSGKEGWDGYVTGVGVEWEGGTGRAQLSPLEHRGANLVKPRVQNHI